MKLSQCLVHVLKFTIYMWIRVAEFPGTLQGFQLRDLIIYHKNCLFLR